MKVAFTTLGCRSNQHDTAEMQTLLEQGGFFVVGSGEQADIYVVNSCTVTGKSDYSSRLAVKKSLGINKNKLRLRLHGNDELAHYSSACYDIEYNFDFGWSELEGIADRGTFDLDQHIEASGKKLTYFDQVNNQHIVPAVVEA